MKVLDFKHLLECEVIGNLYKNYQVDVCFDYVVIKTDMDYFTGVFIERLIEFVKRYDLHYFFCFKNGRISFDKRDIIEFNYEQKLKS